MKKETKWFCENASQLERFAGEWVLFSLKEGVVGNGASLQRVLRAAEKRKIQQKPYVFHVPSKEDLDLPLPGFKH